MQRAKVVERPTIRKLGALFAVALSVCLVAALPAQADRPDHGVRWQACPTDVSPNFECAKVRAPLDYDRPRGRPISLALARLPASDPAAKIGSIFVNPGGPGGSGVDMVLQAGPQLFGEKVRTHFDLVGFDPRGIVRSSPLICFGSFEESLAVFPPFAFPTTPEEEALVAELDTTLNSACQTRGGAVIDHMATADVARDLDLLRRAVGDRRLNYVGYSYGSFLGVTYANLFPDRVRALVVDGVLDPIAWTTGRGDEALTQPFSTRLRSDAGAQATLKEFFRLCDEAGAEGCAFAGDAAARFAALAERLRAAPTEITDPVTGEIFPFTYADLIGNALGAMYYSGSWPDFAQFLAEVEAAANPSALGHALRAVGEKSGLAVGEKRPVPYENFVEGFPGVACSDSDNPDGHSHWSLAGGAADQTFGYFGRPWTWASSPCAVWEGFDDDRYLGPFNRATANPVLVVGNLFDPATRYEGAVLVDNLLPNSSLLTVKGWAHTSIMLSQCADETVSQYLLDGSTPPEGKTCAQDFAPFGAAATPGGGRLRARQQARAEIMSEIALPPGR
jgi:pimeloyl-ACP methyl ester carboxylesterase